MTFSPAQRNATVLGLSFAAIIGAGWFLSSGEESGGSDAGPADARSARTRGSDSGSPTTDDDAASPKVAPAEFPKSTPRQEWVARRDSIAQASARKPAAAAAVIDRKSYKPMIEEAKRAQSEAFRSCTKGRPAGALGVLILRTRVLGAPDTGTIYDSIEVVEDDGSSEEMIECLKGKMYEYVGETPPHAFNETTISTMFGQSPSGKFDDEWKRTMFRGIVLANLEHLRDCEPGTNEIAGVVELSMSFGEELSGTQIRIVSTSASPAVTQCVVDQVRSWRFMSLLDGEYNYRFAVPVDLENARL